MTSEYSKQKCFLHTGEKFREVVEEYIRNALSKGVPPLFVDLRPLYDDPAKFEIIQAISSRLHDNLTKHSSYDENGAPEPPTALLWLYYFLGQIYDFQKEYDKAIAIVEKAIEHTPTLIELFLLKGKIFKVCEILPFVDKNYISYVTMVILPHCCLGVFT